MSEHIEKIEQLEKHGWRPMPENATPEMLEGHSKILVIQPGWYTVYMASYKDDKYAVKPRPHWQYGLGSTRNCSPPKWWQPIPEVPEHLKEDK